MLNVLRMQGDKSMDFVDPRSLEVVARAFQLTAKATVKAYKSKQVAYTVRMEGMMLSVSVFDGGRVHRTLMSDTGTGVEDHR